MNIKELEGRLRKVRSAREKLKILDTLASHYYDQEDYQKAIRYYAQAEALAAPGNSKAYYTGQKGICQYLLHQDKEAKESLLSAQQMSRPCEADFVPEIHGLVYYFLGSLYEYNGDNEASLLSRQEALKYLDYLHREAQWMLLAGLSRNHEERGENRKAIDFSARAISLIGQNDPELAYLYESLGNNHYELEEYEKALTYYSRVLEVAPDFERKDDVYFSIGLCYQRLTDFRTALKSYLTLLEMKELEPTPESLTWLHTEIAYCHYQLKEHEQSLAAVERGLKERVKSQEELAELRSYLTNNLCALGKHEEAVREGEKTLKLSKKFHNLEIMLPNLALSYYHLGQREKFEFYRDRCNREFPDLSWTKQLNKL